jgi:hypothetical protein
MVKTIEPNVQIDYRPVASMPSMPDLPGHDDTTSSDALFWDEEGKRVTRGFLGRSIFAPSGRYINPVYYFYTNYSTILLRNPKTGVDEIAPPFFYDKHEELSNLIWNGRYIPQEQTGGRWKDATHLIATKGRRKGWSQYMLRGHCLYYAVVMEQNIGIGLDSESTRDDAKTEFMAAYENLPDFFKGYDIVINTKERVAFGTWQETKDGKRRSVVNHNVYFYAMDKSPGKFRGKRLSLVFLDEVGKYRNLKAVIRATRDCLLLGAVSFGQFVIGGTSDAIDNSTTDYRDKYREAKVDPMWQTFFISSDELTDPFIDFESGTSLRAEARAHHEKERAKLRLSGKSEDLYGYICENPLNEEEGFLGGGGSTYDVEAMNEQHLWIIQNRKENDLFFAKLKKKKNADNQFTNQVSIVRPGLNEPAVEEGWQFYGPACSPRPDLPGAFLMTVDDVANDTAEHSDSKVAIIVYLRATHYEGEYDLPIAVFHARAGSKLLNWREVEKGILFWQSDILIENNDEGLVNFLKEKGLRQYIKKVGKKYGFRQTEQTIATAEVLIQEAIERGDHHRWYFPSILEALKTPRVTNNDIRSAFETLYLFLDMMKSIPVLKDEIETIKQYHMDVRAKSPIAIGPQDRNQLGSKGAKVASKKLFNWQSF